MGLEGKLQEARIQAQMRLARHYVDVMRDTNTVYLQGTDNSVSALASFDTERAQIERWWAWLSARAENHDEAAGLLVAMTRDSKKILQIRLSPAEVLVWHETALNAAQRLGDKTAVATHLCGMADAQVLLGNTEHGNALLLQCCSLTEQASHWQQLADALVTLAFHESNWGKLDDAAKHGLRALELYQQLGDIRGKGDCLHRLGWIATSSGEWEKAETYLQASHAIALQLGDLVQIGSTLHNLGVIYNRTGKYAEASEKHLQALEFSKRLGDEQGAISIMMGVASAYRQAQKIAETQDVLLKALAIAKRTGRIRSQVSILANLGMLADDNHDYADAARYLEESLSLSRAQGLSYDTCVNCGNLIFAVVGLGLFDKARQLLREGMELAISIAAVPLKTTMVASAVYIWVHSSSVQTDETIQREMMEHAVYWAGMVLTCPGALQANRAGVRALRSRMDALLSAERVDDLFKQGEQVSIDDVIPGILDILRASPSPDAA